MVAYQHNVSRCGCLSVKCLSVQSVEQSVDVVAYQHNAQREKLVLQEASDHLDGLCMQQSAGTLQCHWVYAYGSD